MNSLPVLNIKDESDVYRLSQIVRVEALDLGFGSFIAGLLSSAASEIATNVVRYGVHGEAVIRHSENHKGIIIKINDCGPGIANIEQAMHDGFSSTNSLGLGLGAAKRSVDEMIINSTESGTEIILKKYLPVPREEIDTGMVSFSAIGSHVNGDAYFVKGYEGDKLIAVICDGAGTGEKARQSSQVIEHLLKKSYALPLCELVTIGHNMIQELQYSRGVELGMLRITPTEIESLIMGNVSIHAHSEPYTSFPFQNGSMGLSIPSPLHVHKTERPDQFCYVLHSDGIVEIDYATIFLDTPSAQKIAERVFDNAAVTDDDATVVVLKSP